MNYLQIKHENTQIFKNGSFPQMRSFVYASAPEVPELQRDKTFFVRDAIVHKDTISAVLRFHSSKTAALNFANAMVPGGGYIVGGNAQEEALCRASLLYETLRTAKSFYRKNRLHLLPDYTDTMIYSQNVPIIRTNSGERLPEPVYCDFITAPAVNRTLAKFLFPPRKLDQIMQQRIEGIIRLAAAQSLDTLILGAFGCGVFGNRRETVYPMFESAINRFLPDSVTVIFADPTVETVRERILLRGGTQAAKAGVCGCSSGTFIKGGLSNGQNQNDNPARRNGRR